MIFGLLEKNVGVKLPVTHFKAKLIQNNDNRKPFILIAHIHYAF